VSRQAESIALVNAHLKMVKARLIQRAALSLLGETLQQSLRGIPLGIDICCRRQGYSMPSPAASRAPARNILRRFGRSRRGSAAVEFALIAPPFFALLFAIIETAIVFFASQVLETITQDSARLIATGQAQTGQVPLCQPPGNTTPVPCTQVTFKKYVCSQIPALFSCDQVYVDVESYPAFTNVVINSQIDSGGNFINNMQYNPGSPGAIVVVRLFYQWPLFVTGLGYNISNLTGSQRLLTATAAFKNEPY
jgi:Flp pilus assembly protein TadG